MAMLHYSVISSLDGYVADEEGNFDWAEPDEEVHSFVNDVVRSHGTYLDGLRLPLQLLDHRRFDNGMVYLRYRPRR